MQINFVGIVEYAFQVGPKKAAKKLKHDFVIFAAKDFETKVNNLLAAPRRRAAPRPAPKAKKPTNVGPEVLEAEIVHPSEAPK